MKKTTQLFIWLLIVAHISIGQRANDDRVLLQGFYWESVSDRSGNWYQYVESLASDMSSAGIDMIWLPPPSDAESPEGYLPRQLNNFANSYGSLSEHQNMLNTLNNNGIEAIADIVINHRVGSSNWVDFTNPTWGTNAITNNDEVWSQPEYSGISLRGNADTGTGYEAARDVDHTQTFVQNDIKSWMDNLKAIGYDGWRYDYVHGFDEYYFTLYNNHSNPTFSVGENWTSDKQTIQNWIDETGSAAFDFPTYYALKAVIRDNNYSYLTYQGAPSGGIGWDPRNNVTFIENHDTPRYDPDNNVLGGGNVGQAYAYLLTHPGVPTIFWSHMYEWGSSVTNEIKESIRVRKEAGIHSQSAITILASQADVYAAQISGNAKEVVLKMGYGNWDPSSAGLGSDWTLETSGTNYAIWSKGDGTTTPIGGEMTVYVEGYTHAYAWDDNENQLLGAWPGSQMSTNSDGWRTITIDASCSNVIFSNNGSSQTDDLYTCEDEPYYYDNDWHANSPDNDDDDDDNDDNTGMMNISVEGYSHAYAWDDNENQLLGAWPGTQMTTNSDGWRTITIDAACSNIIFSNNGSNQTDDLYTCEDEPYYYDNDWHANAPNTSTPDDLTVYAQGYTHAYAWDDAGNSLLGSWPGTQMTQGGTWNYITIDAACSNIIFSYSGSSQTADLNTCGPDSYWYNNRWYTSNPLGGGRISDSYEMANELSYVTYPNPFADQTTLSFTLEHDEHVALWIYTLSGKGIKIMEGDFKKGLVEYKINVSELPGAEPFYISRLHIGEQIISTKLTIIR